MTSHFNTSLSEVYEKVNSLTTKHCTELYTTSHIQ